MIKAYLNFFLNGVAVGVGVGVGVPIFPNGANPFKIPCVGVAVGPQLKNDEKVKGQVGVGVGVAEVVNARYVYLFASHELFTFE